MSPAIAEIVLVEDPGLFEQAHGAIDRGDRNARIHRHGAGMQLFHIGMIGGFGQHAGDHPALIGDPEAALRAKRFYIDCLLHNVSGQRKASLIIDPRGDSSTVRNAIPHYALGLRPRLIPGLRPRPIFLASSRRFSA